MGWVNRTRPAGARVVGVMVGAGMGWVYRTRPAGACVVGVMVGGLGQQDEDRRGVRGGGGSGCAEVPPCPPVAPCMAFRVLPARPRSLLRCRGGAVVCTPSPLGMGPTAAQACRLGPRPWASLAFFSQCPLPRAPVRHLPCRPPRWAAWMPAGLCVLPPP